MKKTNVYLNQSIVNYLNQLVDSSNAEDKFTLESVKKLLNVANTTDSPSLQSIFDKGIEVLYPNGLEPLNTTVSDGIPENLKGNSKFIAFLDNVTKKGFFGELSKDSEEYKERLLKVVAKFEAKFKPELDIETKALEFKTKGNDFLKSGDMLKAVDMYSEAIKLSPTGKSTHIFYCNRAAAYQHLGENEKAVEDCSMALALESSYVKAHSRLAKIYQNLGRDEDAKNSAQTALSLEPTNSGATEVLKALGGMTQKEAPTSPFGNMGAGGMPNLGGMDFGAMMNNPMVKQMAEQMAKNPDMMSNMASMMGGLGGSGGGGMPDFGAMMKQMGQDPNMMDSLGGLMGKKKDDDEPSSTT